MPKAGAADVKPKVAKLAAWKHVTPEEAGRLIAAAGKRGRYPFRELVRLTYRHGMRAGEAVGLR